MTELCEKAKGERTKNIEKESLNIRRVDGTHKYGFLDRFLFSNRFLWIIRYSKKLRHGPGCVKQNIKTSFTCFLLSKQLSHSVWKDIVMKMLDVWLKMLNTMLNCIYSSIRDFDSFIQSNKRRLQRKESVIQETKPWYKLVCRRKHFVMTPSRGEEWLDPTLIELQIMMQFTVRHTNIGHNSNNNFLFLPLNLHHVNSTYINKSLQW